MCAEPSTSSAATSSSAPSWAPWRGREVSGKTLWAVALVLCVASITSQGIQSGLPGIWLGMDHVITIVQLLAALTSQLAAVLSAGLIVALLTASSTRRGLSATWRVVSGWVGVCTLLALMVASARPLWGILPLALAISGAMLGLFAMRIAAAHAETRAPAGVVGAAVVASLCVTLSAEIWLALEGQPGAELWLRVGATGHLLFEALALLVATAWFFACLARRGWAASRWTPLLALLLLLAGGLSYLAYLGQAADAAGVLLLAKRWIDSLPVRPDPYLSPHLAPFIEWLRWLLVIALLVMAPGGRWRAVTVALALMARGALDVPLGAASMVLASLALGLAAAQHATSPLSLRSAGNGASRVPASVPDSG